MNIIRKPTSLLIMLVTKWDKPMKYKKKVQRLKDRQAWWDKQSDSFKRATTRPGSVKQK